MTEVRLQKYLAERGIASRRRAADLIRQGRVSVGGTVVTEPGLHVPGSGAQIRVDGNVVNDAAPRARTIMVHKPRGYICSKSSQSKTTPTVYGLIASIEGRLVTAGRLDKESEGLILMSNDGDLIHQLTHPRFAHVKTYEVTVTGDVTSRAINTLQSRLVIDGYRIHPANVTVCARDSAGTLLKFMLTEGRNRQIRKMCARAGLRVRTLKRVAIGDLRLGKLRPAEWRPLTSRELSSLRN